jgi:3-hydroxybutyryl-CoA dehydrogenase
MKNIVVIGGGTMGNGIAHTAAATGFDVTLIDASQEILYRATSTISANLQRGVDKGKLTAAAKMTVLGRIKTAADMKAVANADIVIEAIVENLAAKSELFAKLDHSAKADCIRSDPRNGDVG